VLHRAYLGALHRSAAFYSTLEPLVSIGAMSDAVIEMVSCSRLKRLLQRAGVRVAEVDI